jgi:hypothetical protein
MPPHVDANVLIKTAEKWCQIRSKEVFRAEQSRDLSCFSLFQTFYPSHEEKLQAAVVKLLSTNVHKLRQVDAPFSHGNLEYPTKVDRNSFSLSADEQSWLMAGEMKWYREHSQEVCGAVVSTLIQRARQFLALYGHTKARLEPTSCVPEQLDGMVATISAREDRQAVIFTAGMTVRLVHSRQVSVVKRVFGDGMVFLQHEGGDSGTYHPSRLIESQRIHLSLPVPLNSEHQDNFLSFVTLVHDVIRTRPSGSSVEERGALAKEWEAREDRLSPEGRESVISALQDNNFMLFWRNPVEITWRELLALAAWAGQRKGGSGGISA